MQGNVRLLVVLVACAMLIVGNSCGSDKKAEEKGSAEGTDFLINNERRPSLPPPDPNKETDDSAADESFKYKTKVGEEIVFTADVKAGDDVDDWNIEQNDTLQALGEKVVRFTFRQPGTYRVKLYTTKAHTVEKLVQVYARDGSTDMVNGVEQLAEVQGSNSNKTTTKSSIDPAPEKREPVKTAPPKDKEVAQKEPKAGKSLLEGATTRKDPSEKTATIAPPPKAQPKIETPKPALPPPVAAPPKKEVTKIAVAEPKKEPAKVPVTTAIPAAPLLFKTPDKVGAVGKSKPEEDGAWVDKSTTTLTPQKKCKIVQGYVFANGSGKLKATIRNNQTGVSYPLSTNVNKGINQILMDEFDDMVLEPGSTYTITLEPSSGVKIENAAALNPSIRENPILKLDYKGNVTLFDLKFKY